MNTEKIKNLRDELEITQNELAEKLGCTRSALSLWEINKNTKHEVQSLHKKQ